MSAYRFAEGNFARPERISFLSGPTAVRNACRFLFDERGRPSLRIFSVILSDVRRQLNESKDPLLDGTTKISHRNFTRVPATLADRNALPHPLPIGMEGLLDSGSAFAAPSLKMTRR